MAYIVEKDWITKAGYRAVVTISLNNDGTKRHRCGYVGVTKEHPAYQKDYSEQLDSIIDCHGGLTYSGGNDKYPIEAEGIWWFGFDCAHSEDATIDKTEFDFIYSIGGTVRTLEYVEVECESIASQLLQIK